MNCLKVMQPGILSCFQDLGRTGWRKFGVPLSGPMDKRAFIAANLLLGNDENSTALEITLQGLKVEALCNCHVAVTGADLGFSINGEYLPPWTSHKIEAGDLLWFKGRKNGLRAYLAVSGGFEAPKYLNSTSVFQMGNMGQPISKNQVLQQAASHEKQSFLKQLPEHLLPPSNPPMKIRVISGPQDQAFSRTGRETFFDSKYKVTPQSNRMALRLDGPSLEHKGAADIISEAVVPGSIQVPQDGRPIVLLADAQTTGGYAKIGTAISPDLDLLGQTIPGDTISFEAVTLAEADQARQKHYKLLGWLWSANN
jgi:antagonist of KipI